MALINCPNCNHADVSSTATSCPHCKYNIKKHFERIKQEQEVKAKEQQMKYIICPECKNDKVPKMPYSVQNADLVLQSIYESKKCRSK